MDIMHLSSLEELDISECNFPHVPPAIWKLHNLKTLNISRNKITMLVPEVGNLTKLRHLNAQLTNISTLPPEIAFCQDLEVLLLWGNIIDSLPETLRELPVLHTLAINYQSFCTIIDAYMDNLLMKGQIQSEHIPPVLFEIPSLQALNLEATKINTLPERCTASLQEFYLQRNFLAKVPSIVFGIDTLRVVDLSNNFISVLPEELGKLSHLESFRCDNNKVDSIPVTLCALTSLKLVSLGGNKITLIPPQIGNLTKLQSLVLDRNQISELPENIIQLTALETLDLTANQLTALPICFYRMKSLTRAHTYDKLTKAGLWLHQNPITVPPQEIWKTDDPTKIYKHLKKLEIMQTENLQRQKLVILGEEQCGKTSLINTLITGKSLLTAALRDTTNVALYTSWRTDNDVSFMVIDTGGNKVYQMTHPLFLSSKALYVIVYDHRKYTAQKHYSAIGYWLDLLHLHTPGAIVKIIGTQTDLCAETISNSTLDVVREELARQMSQTQERIKEEITNLEKKIKEKSTRNKSVDLVEHLQKQKSHMEYIHANPLRIQGDISLVSCSEGIPGVMSLLQELEYLAVNKELLPHAQRFIAEDWKQFRRTLKLQSQFYSLTWDQVKSFAKKHNIWGEALLDCLHFLCDTGEILWFKNIPELKDTIFHNPRSLIDIVQGIFRHDHETFLTFPDNLILTSKGQFTASTFSEARNALKQWGQISRPMMQCLWFYMRLDYEHFNLLCNLVPKLDLCYQVPQPETPLRRSEFNQLLVVPWYNKDPEPGDKQPLWPSTLTTGQMELRIDFTFPVHFPTGLFERLSCRLQKLVMLRMDWQDLIYADAETEDGGELKLLVRRHLHHDNLTPVLTVAARGEGLDDVSFVMKDICGDLCHLLLDYPGLAWHVVFNKIHSKEATMMDCFPEGSLLCQ